MISFANTISCRPSTTTTQTNRCVAAAEQLGFTGLRSDCSFEEIYPTTTLGDANYAGLYRLIDAVAASTVLQYLWLSIGPYPSVNNATWTALLGTYGSSARLVKKRPPAGTANAGWQKITDFTNDLILKAKTRWINAGGSVNDLYFQIWQEPGIGASDGPQTEDVVVGGTTLGNASLDAIANLGSGLWDRDENWSSMSGINAGYANVRGLVDNMAFMFPQLDLQGCHWVFPAFEASNSTTYNNEISSATGDHTPIYSYLITETGKLEFDIHNYYGTLMNTNPRNAYIYADNSLQKICENRAALEVLLDADYTTGISILYHSSEYGVKASWLYGTDADADTWTHVGRGVIWRQLIEAMLHSGFTSVGFEELHADPVTGGDDFYIMDTSGNPTVGSKGIGQAHSLYIDTSGAVPWIVGGDSITFRKGTNETVY